LPWAIVTSKEALQVEIYRIRFKPNMAKRLTWLL